MVPNSLRLILWLSIMIHQKQKKTVHTFLNQTFNKRKQGFQGGFRLRHFIAWGISMVNCNRNLFKVQIRQILIWIEVWHEE